MARSRNIKPGFFTNDNLADIEPIGRLLFIGLWTICDREGRIEDRHRRIKAEVLPYDNCDVDALLQDLAKHGFILRYVVGGEKYIQVLNFTKHQNPHVKESASTIPAPDMSSASTAQAPEQVNVDTGTDQTSDNLNSEICNENNGLSEHHTSTVQAPEKHGSSHADSLILKPDSLILKPETGIKKTNKKEIPDTDDPTSTSVVSLASPVPDREPDKPPSPVSPHGAIATYVRSQGIHAVSTDQELVNLVKAGATMAHFVDALPVCRERQKGWKYLLGIVKNMLQEAEQQVRQPRSQAPPRINRQEQLEAQNRAVAERLAREIT